MADKRKRKTEYVVSGGVDTSLTKDQPDEDDTEQNQEPPPPVENKTEQSKELPPNEKEQEINKPSELKAPEQEVKEPEKSKEISLPGGDFLKKEGSDKNPFDVRLSILRTDPRMIKVDQFYPALEHQFNKSNTKFMEEQDKRVERAMQEIVEESSTFTYDDSMSGREDTQNSMALVTAPIKEETEEKQLDDNNSCKQVRRGK